MKALIRTVLLCLMHLEEPAWKLAVPGTDFTQELPHTGAPSEVRFLVSL